VFHVEHFFRSNIAPIAAPSTPAALLLEGCLRLGVPCSPHVACRLVLYLQELVRWNAKINLTAIETELEIISKHFLDSIAAFRLFEPRPGLRVLDVGSGAGFPGMVLKLQAPDLIVTLLEPSSKKAAFLHHLAGLLGVPGIKIETKRIEDVKEGTFDLITSRALKPDVVLGAASRLLSPGGSVLLYRVKPLKIPPPGFSIVRQFTFELPFLKSPRTLVSLQLARY
jgi:16S rRNA (guanine527-N7)-methyltransferase